MVLNSLLSAARIESGHVVSTASFIDLATDRNLSGYGGVSDLSNDLNSTQYNYSKRIWNNVDRRAWFQFKVLDGHSATGVMPVGLLDLQKTTNGAKHNNDHDIRSTSFFLIPPLFIPPVYVRPSVHFWFSTTIGSNDAMRSIPMNTLSTRSC
jgi:hypothetical protein